MNKKLLIGSHVSLSSPHYLLGCVLETIENGGSTFMFYTGAPQNTIRKDVNLFKINEAKTLMKQHDIDINNVVVHAPYIINLCSDKELTRKLGVDFLLNEIKRCDQIGVRLLVLHPGCYLSQTNKIGLQYIVNNLNYVLNKIDTNIIICIETMAGKGTEVGKTIDEIKYIIDNIEKKQNIGVCLDTCHLNDGGYNMQYFDDFLNQFESKINLNYIKVIHINDSKNPLNSHKDRHENIGYGYIGFESLNYIVHHHKLENIPKILETPYYLDSISNKPISPYKDEINILKTQKWYDFKNKKD